MKTKIYLDSKADKEGKNQVFFYIVGGGSRSKIFSGVKIDPANWHNGIIGKNEENHDLKNSLIQARFAILSRIITESRLNLSVLSTEAIKQKYLSKLEEKKAPSVHQKNLLVDYMEFYKDKYLSSKKENTSRGIKQVITHVRAFDPAITVEGLDHTWLNGYCKYLVGKTLQDSTIKERHLKEIKGVCKEAAKNGIKIKETVLTFEWESKSKQPFAATWQEVEAILAIREFVLPMQEKVRDLFILACNTGLRNSDWYQFSKINLQTQADQNMLHVHLTKTNFDYSIPINRQVMEILLKYNFEIPAISQQEFNRQIKLVAQMVVTGQSSKVKMIGHKRHVEIRERAKLFSSHTGRRTFGRHFLDRGGSVYVLAQIFGHKSIETTLKYIGYQPQEVINEYRKVFS